MPDIPLSLAISYYDHVGDLVRGRVRAEGVALTPIERPVEEIFFRMVHFGEWDVSEFSLAKYVSLVASGAPPFRAIPVFPSRMFRHSAFYVAASAKIAGPRDLIGRSVGIPEWAQTAGAYARGYLQHQCGVALRDIHWVQAGVNQAGRSEKVNLALPHGVNIERVQDSSLSELLLRGELDAIISAREPAPFLDSDPRIARLWPDYRTVEETYYRETGIFPIMHVVVIKTAVLDQHPWIAMNLYNAFEQAKANSLRALITPTSSRVPIAWSQYAAAQARQIFGEDFWPYGIEANRHTLAAFLQYCWEQGICSREVSVDELFPRELGKFVRV